MKKLLLLILLFSLSLDSFGQFKLSPKGVFLNEKTGKDFIVNSYVGVLKDDLYKFVENKIVEIFVSPKDVISKSEDMISILCTGSFKSKEYSFDVVFTYKYKILINFKGDKIRYSITPMSLYKTGNGNRSWKFDDFFKKDGELRKPRTKAYNDLNDATNTLISKFFYKVDNSLDWE